MQQVRLVMGQVTPAQVERAKALRKDFYPENQMLPDFGAIVRLIEGWLADVERETWEAAAAIVEGAGKGARYTEAQNAFAHALGDLAKRLRARAAARGKERG